MNRLHFVSVVFLSVTLWVIKGSAQNRTIDSLQLALENAKHDSMRANALLAIVQIIYNDNPDTAVFLLEKVVLLSENNLKSTSSASPNYLFFLKKQALALNNLAFVYERKCDGAHAMKYYQESISKYERSRDTGGMAIALNSLGSLYINQGGLEKAKQCLIKALKLFESNTDRKEVAETLVNLGYLYDLKGDIPNALKHYGKGFDLYKKLGDRSGEATSLNNLGFIYYNQGNISKALECFNLSLALREEIGEKAGIASALDNIGAVYTSQGDYANALASHTKALKIHASIGNKSGEAYCLNNIGAIYKIQGRFTNALDYFLKCIKIREEIGEKAEMAYSLNSIGTIYKALGDVPKALEFYHKGLGISEQIGETRGVVMSYFNIANAYAIIKNHQKSIDYASRGMKLSQELGFPENIKNISELLTKVYKATGNHKLALENYELYIKMRDSLNNLETQKATIKQQTKYEYDKQKAVADEKHAADIKQQEEKAAAEKKRQNIVIASVSVVLLLVAVFSVILFNRFRITQRQKAVIEQKEIETRHQKHIIEEKHKEITDSINYAERIQRSFLATQSHLDSHLNASSRYVPIDFGTTRTDTVRPVISSADEGGVSRNDSNYFILFQPKDVVSGDFYWSATLNNGNFALATADSTGHGVPGAIMSLLNITSLEKAIETETSPDKILNATRKIIIERLKKDGSPDGGKDGMDCSLCVFDFKHNKLFVANAHNPVWIVRGASSRYDAHTSASARTDTNGGVTSSRLGSAQPRRIEKRHRQML